MRAYAEKLKERKKECNPSFWETEVEKYEFQIEDNDTFKMQCIDKFAKT